VKRVLTGICGLDEMLRGGIPQGRCTLACGGPGSGKTIFGVQFLHSGVTQFGENGLFVSLDESAEHLREDMAAFGWNLEKLEKKGRFCIIDASPIRRIPGKVKIGDLSIGKRDFSILSLIEIIRTKAAKIHAKRVVVDPITTLLLQCPDDSEKRNAVLDLFEAISALGTTNVVTTELRATTLARTVKAEEFLSDGVIIFNVFHENRELVKAIQIEKMRGIAHDQQLRPYRICDEGMIVYPKESALSSPIEVAAAFT
jgi:circadian clock protein KaiC